ncbi:uncharacterized protein LY89DRAFT_692470 [Mollisia scopiformis]|uniref:DUF202 domain-containing protein n=1 Tax=Mollisia scopiformis TaxID=149040 RepID=A0A132B2L7_MOLSC|nr:uncharacterized protein LY89DRAFT_692470 [Mollisia scopiformis]KUJ06493.1 hypothetical protein LY89DRAFT_692470 [Mollisia scopiformis]
MATCTQADEEEAERQTRYSECGIPIGAAPVYVEEHQGENVFCLPPLLGPLLFVNKDSDARDHCANERTFLSYLRLSLYMAVVAIAIVISFHLKTTPSQLELRMAQPLGAIFWFLSFCCLALGFGNYLKTVNKYSRRVAIVQTGWKTQTIFSIVAISIVGVCVLFLATNSKRS